MDESIRGVGEPDDAAPFAGPARSEAYLARQSELKRLIQEAWDSGPARTARSADQIIREGMERLKRVRGA